jgi:hypothetical protein
MSAPGHPEGRRVTDDDFRPEDLDIEELDQAFLAALRSGRPADLPVVGYGEISVAFGWPRDRPTVVAKSLPPFPDVRRYEAYVDLLAEYLDVLRSRDVEPLPTTVRAVIEGPDRRAYVLQPWVPWEEVGPVVLERSDPDDGEALLGGIVAAVLRASDAMVGLDAQVSNWVLTEGRLRYLDVSTPMLRDPDGHDRLDSGLFCEAMPWLLRRPTNRFLAPELLSPYHDPRRVVLDAAGNLVRERLARWIPVLLRVANPHLERPLTIDEVRRFYRTNARLWGSLQLLRRMDRGWQQHVRRRQYPFLLPESYQR